MNQLYDWENLLLAYRKAAKGKRWTGRKALPEDSSMYFTGDDLFAIHRPRGLPIGNLTSQFWANCYLNPDQRLLKRKKGIAFQRKLKNLRVLVELGGLTRAQFEASIQGWVNHVRWGNTWRLRYALLNTQTVT